MSRTGRLALAIVIALIVIALACFIPRKLHASEDHADALARLRSNLASEKAFADMIAAKNDFVTEALAKAQGELATVTAASAACTASDARHVKELKAATSAKIELQQEHDYLHSYCGVPMIWRGLSLLWAWLLGTLLALALAYTALRIWFPPAAVLMNGVLTAAVHVVFPASRTGLLVAAFAFVSAIIISRESEGEASALHLQAPIGQQVSGAARSASPSTARAPFSAEVFA